MLREAEGAGDMDLKCFTTDAKVENTMRKHNVEHLLKNPEKGPSGCEICQSLRPRLDQIVLNRELLRCRCWIMAIRECETG